MRKIFSLSLFIVFLIGISFVYAYGEENFAKAEELIKSKILCSELSEEQLESIGEYYMEQMHPGELHEIMDERMGGEGSESLRQAHIRIARVFYCGDHGMMSRGMIDVMMGRSGTSMMENNRFYYRGEENYGSLYGDLLLIFLIVIIIVVILLIFWIAKQSQNTSKIRMGK